MIVIEQFAHALLVQTLALSIASAVVRLLQLAAVRRLGAGAGYLAWLLVPVTLLAVALPHQAAGATILHLSVPAVFPEWIATPAPAQARHASLVPTLLMAAWAMGAALLAVLMLRRQLGFEALVTPSPDGRAACLPAGAGPAVLGVWRRRIVLPRDFDIAFDADERRLMLAHEAVHLRRADNAWNLLGSALLVVHWFNPVAWWAWRRLRADQEQSCDAAVLRQASPGAVATYAQALLKVQGIALTAPLATSWQSSHPLVERIRMLKIHRISPARHRVGLHATALSILFGGIGSYGLGAGAAVSPEALPREQTSVQTTVTTEYDGWPGSRRPMKLLAIGSQRTTLRLAADASSHTLTSEIAFTATPLPDRRVQIDAELRYGDALFATPRVITHDGEPARLEMKSDSEGHVFAVTLVPRLVEPRPALPPASAPPQRAP